jgi:ribonuclease Z
LTAWTYAATWNRRFAASFPMPRRGGAPRASVDGVGGGALVPAKLKVAELRAELARLGLATTGKKAELQARLLAATAVDVSAEANDTDNGGDAASRDGGVAESDAEKPSSRVPAPEDSTYLTVSADDDSLELEAGQPSPSERSKNTHARYQRTMFNSRPAENVPGGEAIGADSVTNFSGMELTFLGTSSGSPSFTRNVSSYALRLTDEIWLFDCGEATQHQLMRSNLRYSKITRVFITHMHGDHIFGLPGLICALSGASAEKRRVHGKDPDPLYITGPPGICEFVKAAIACSRTVLGLPLVVTELTAPGNGVAGAGAADGAADPRAVSAQTHFAADARHKMFLGERWPDNGAATAPHFKDREGWASAWDGSLTLPFWTVHREKSKNAGGDRGGERGGLVVRAAPLRHPVPCFGYVVDEPDQAGRIDAELCVSLGLPPGKEYARLKAGFDVQTKEGKTITPAMVLGCDRPGRRLCLLGDTCDSVGIARLARGADVLVHESTFAAYKHQEAVYKGHSTSVMAGEFARVIKARNLLLTHFSNRYGTANTRQNGTDGSEPRESTGSRRRGAPQRRTRSRTTWPSPRARRRTCALPRRRSSRSSRGSCAKPRRPRATTGSSPPLTFSPSTCAGARASTRLTTPRGTATRCSTGRSSRRRWRRTRTRGGEWRTEARATTRKTTPRHPRHPRHPATRGGASAGAARAGAGAPSRGTRGTRGPGAERTGPRPTARAGEGGGGRRHAIGSRARRMAVSSGGARAKARAALRGARGAPSGASSEEERLARRSACAPRRSTRKPRPWTPRRSCATSAPETKSEE